MKKKGFTLIELLAVIVILGVLAVIITPVVTGIISKAEDDAYKKQIDNIVKAAKTWNLNNPDDLPDNALCRASAEKVNALVYSSGNPYYSSSYISEKVGLLVEDEGAYTPGVTYTCNVGDGERIFYVLEESGNNVSLILGTSLGEPIAWCKSGNDNSCAATGAKESLENSTKNWKKLNPSQIKLPTYDQVYTAAGNSKNSLPIWLRSYTDDNVAFGYWTSTPHASYSFNAWIVEVDNNTISGNYVANSGTVAGCSIRPVITISKSQLTTDTSISNKFYLSLDTLVNDGIIENSDIINPKTNEEMEGCISITYSEEYQQYEYKYISDNNLCK